jgi:hypothetical protein
VYHEYDPVFEEAQRHDVLKPRVRVKFSMHLRILSRQMLCVGGSQLPFGWSFNSIAQVPLQVRVG